MTSQNEEAEELMRRIEKEEETLAYEYPDKKVYHLCIVNLVIGTLYCSKGNFEFGITRVIKGGVMSRSIFRFCIHLVELTFSFPKLCPILKSGV